MNESHVVSDLSAYLDGGLADEDVRRVESHLSECESCREEWVYLKHVQGLLKRRSQIPSPGLWSGVAARILAPNGTTFWGQFEWVGKRLVPVLAAAAVVVLAVFGSFHSDDAGVTVDEFLLAEWSSEEVDGLVLYEVDVSRDDILFLTAPEVESLPSQR
jgi:anti-sigma factor RsiW